MLEMKLGIAGTAKNTGKTTTTAAILAALRSRNIPIYLTSIGYDGENIDNVTGLPKPKLRVEAGDTVATAHECLKVSTAGLETVIPTDLHTPLGKIVVCRVTAPGLVVTAGPNKSAEVKKLADTLRNLGPGVMIFDGALNRIAPMVETDGFILATGAARTPDIARLSRETELIWRLANLPAVLRAAELAERKITHITLLDGQLREIKSWPYTSLLAETDAAAISNETFPDGGYLYIPGIIGEKALAMLAGELERRPRRLQLTFADPIKLLVAGNPVGYYQWIEQIEKAGAMVGVQNRIPMLAATINPFYPEYRVESNTYKPAFVDFVRLQVAIQRKIGVPVYNVVKQGAKGLVDIILAKARPWQSPDTIEF